MTFMHIVRLRDALPSRGCMSPMGEVIKSPGADNVIWNSSNPAKLPEWPGFIVPFDEYVSIHHDYDWLAFDALDKLTVETTDPPFPGESYFRITGRNDAGGGTSVIPLMAGLCPEGLAEEPWDPVSFRVTAGVDVTWTVLARSPEEKTLGLQLDWFGGTFNPDALGGIDVELVDSEQHQLSSSWDTYVLQATTPADGYYMVSAAGDSASEVFTIDIGHASLTLG